MQRPKRPLLLGIDQSVTLLDLREYAMRAMSDGFDGVEWSVPASIEQPQPAIPRLESIPIRALAVRCEMMDVPLAVQSVSVQLQTARSLGAMLLSLSIPPVRRSDDGRGFARYQDTLNFAYELLRRLRFEAEATGVAIALEVASGGCLLSPVEARELIDTLNSSAIGVCLDVERIAAIGSPWDWLHTLYRRTLVVRCTGMPCTPVSGTSETRDAPFDALIQTLHDASPECPLILAGSAAKSAFAERRRDR